MALGLWGCGDSRRRGTLETHAESLETFIQHALSVVVLFSVVVLLLVSVLVRSVLPPPP